MLARPRDVSSLHVGKLRCHHRAQHSCAYLPVLALPDTGQRCERDAAMLERQIVPAVLLAEDHVR